jgi:uncharacterized protein YecT (DUF1311 family)
MKKFIFMFLIFSGIMFAQEKKDQHPIDKWLDDCLAIGKNQSTAGTIDCIDKAYEKWDKELNKVYRELMAKLKPDDQKVLKEAQKEWIKHRDMEFKLLDKIYGYKEGTMYLPMHADSRMEIVRGRANKLQDYIDLLDEK